MQLRFLLTQHQPTATNAISISAEKQRDKLSKQAFLFSQKIKIESKAQMNRETEKKKLHSFYLARCCRQSLGRIHRIRHIRHIRCRQCHQHQHHHHHRRRRRNRLNYNHLLECLRAEVNHTV